MKTFTPSPDTLNKILTKIKISFSFLLLGIYTISASAEVEQTSKSIPVAKLDSPSQEELTKTKKNLARWHMGAVLYHEDKGHLVATTWREAYDKNSPASLLSDDPTLSYTASIDTHKYIIDLKEYQLVNRFSFRNISAKGRVQIFYSDLLQSTESSRWRSGSEMLKFEEKGFISMDLDPLDARYLLVAMDITQKGDIAGFSAFGELSVIETRYSENPNQDQTADSADLDPETTSYNFASLHSGSRISHVSSGKLEGTNAMLDDDMETSYAFADEKQTVVAVDLQNQREVNRLSILFESSPGSMEFYFVDSLPEDMTTEAPEMAMIYNNQRFEPLLLANTGNNLGDIITVAQETGSAVQRVYVPESFFEDNVSNFSFEIENKQEQFRIEFEKLRGRYLVIRWLLDDVASGQEITAHLKVFEIGLYGDIPEENRILERIPLFEFLEEVPANQNDGNIGEPSLFEPLPLDVPDPLSP